ncbi:hypothetical protein HIM_02764 [Hirsutella minnesotensis 3608]|nr:hypothetical protein HIM_02764 [Hirsutella minnesotensis 3608]
MSCLTRTVALDASTEPLGVVVALLSAHLHKDYYAYEIHDTWYIGLGNYATLIVDPDGKAATKIEQGGTPEKVPITTSLNAVARAFVSENAVHGKIFGQVGFNYSAHVAGQSYNPGKWPMLSLMVPRVQVAVSMDVAVAYGAVDTEVEAVAKLIQGHLLAAASQVVPDNFLDVDLQANSDEYKDRVARAIGQIKEGKFIKAIPSRMVNLTGRVDMLATLYHGRRANTPARSFTFSHGGVQATGFSPEVLLSIDHQVAYTEALAGTELACGSDPDQTRNHLMKDPKEVMEHVIAVKGSIRRLSQFCHPESIAVKSFMSVMQRGNVHHLFSHVTGDTVADKDGWDALPGLVANITVPGVPNQANMEAIEAFEPYPRDLYTGAVLVIDSDMKFFDAALVLRTVFQDENRQWLQAGAGVTALSNPEREFTETCEKLASVAPYVVEEGAM